MRRLQQVGSATSKVQAASLKMPHFHGYWPHSRVQYPAGSWVVVNSGYDDDLSEATVAKLFWFTNLFDPQAGFR